MVKITDYTGLVKAADDYIKFTVLELMNDPHFIGVYMLLLEFEDTEYGKYGLSIYDTNKEEFIEEPIDFESCEMTKELANKQYGFFSSEFDN